MVTATHLAALVRATPPNAGSADPMARQAVVAWGAASIFARAQAVTIVEAEGQPFHIEGVTLEPVNRLGPLLALATLSSLIPWHSVAADEVSEIASAIIAKMGRLDHPTDGLDTIAVIAAAWLDGEEGEIGSMHILAKQAERIAAIAAGDPTRAEMDLVRGLSLSMKRRGLRERYGLILPEEIRNAVGNASYREVAPEVGTSAGDISRTVNGLRRLPEDVAVRLHHRWAYPPPLKQPGLLVTAA